MVCGKVNSLRRRINDLFFTQFKIPDYEYTLDDLRDDYCDICSIGFFISTSPSFKTSAISLLGLVIRCHGHGNVI